MSVDVAFAWVEPNVVGVNGNVPLPHDWLMRAPLASVVRQLPAVDPSADTTRFVVEAVPDTVSAVVDA